MILGCMAIIVSLLRGINVGGAHKVKMDDLRALYESLGMRNAQSYIQSGNVVFETGRKDLRSSRQDSMTPSNNATVFTPTRYCARSPR